MEQPQENETQAPAASMRTQVLQSEQFVNAFMTTGSGSGSLE